MHGRFPSIEHRGSVIDPSDPPCPAAVVQDAIHDLRVRAILDQMRGEGPADVVEAEGDRNPSTGEPSLLHEVVVLGRPLPARSPLLGQRPEVDDVIGTVLGAADPPDAGPEIFWTKPRHLALALPRQNEQGAEGCFSLRQQASALGNRQDIVTAPLARPRHLRPEVGMPMQSAPANEVTDRCRVPVACRSAPLGERET